MAKRSGYDEALIKSVMEECFPKSDPDFVLRRLRDFIGGIGQGFECEGLFFPDVLCDEDKVFKEFIGADSFEGVCFFFSLWDGDPGSYFCIISNEEFYELLCSYTEEVLKDKDEEIQSRAREYLEIFKNDHHL